MIRILVGGVFGAIVGGVFGGIARAHGGTCPLTCNPLAGMAMGALLGTLIMSSTTGCAPSAYTPSPHFFEITDAGQFDREVKSGGVVLVDFYADWCGPCKILKPTLHKIADEYAGRVKVIGVNVDKLDTVAQRYGISGIPDVRIFQGGREIEKITGVRAEKIYTQILDKLVGNKKGAST